MTVGENSHPQWPRECCVGDLGCLREASHEAEMAGQIGQ